VSALDLLDDSFPHGTPAGFDRGCRSGGACLAKPVTGQSCKEAKTRVQRDAGYRALVQSGATVEVLREPERPEQAPAVSAAPRPVPHAATPKLLQEKPTATPGPRKGELVHGTTSGYWRGCRDDCPGDADGITCRQAAAAQKRERRENPQPRKVGRTHGTISGYQAGCRDDCPGGADGTTCREASRIYARERAARKTTDRVAGAPLTPATKESAWPATDTTDEATSSAAPTAPSPAASPTTPPADLTSTPSATTGTRGPTSPDDPSLPTVPSETSSAAPRLSSPPASEQSASRPSTAGTPTPTPDTTNTTTQPPRSPDPVTPFDEPSELLHLTVIATFRAAWLDGYRAGVRAR